MSRANVTNTTLRVELFDVDNGLSQTAVQTLIQDKYGFLWVGTQNGLNRYDGYGFKVYRNQPFDSTSIANDYITDLCEDNDGNIWIGTFNGLSIYNRKDDNFYNFYFNPSNDNSISSNRIFNVYEDSFGVIWVKTEESLDRYNPETNGFTRFNHFVDIFSLTSENNDFSLYEDSKKRFWVGTSDGLMLFDRNLSLFKRYANNANDIHSLSNNRVKHIYEDSKGNIWIATAHGINLFREKTDDFIHYENIPGNNKSLPNNIVNIMFEDSKGNFWIGTEMGFCRFYSNHGEFSPHFNAYYQDKYLFSSTVTSIVEDRTNIIWFGTLSGLIKLDLKSQNFKTYSKTTSGENLFSGNYVSSLYKQSNDIIWVGTWGTGLYIFNRTTGANYRYSENSTGRNICNDYVHTIYRTSQDEMIIGTRNGVQVYNHEDKIFKNFFPKKMEKESERIFSHNRVYEIVEDDDGDLWFASRMGLYSYNRSQIESFRHNPNNPLSISSNEVHALAVDKEGVIWAGTFDGLNRIDKKNKTVERFLQAKDQDNMHIANNEIVSLLMGTDGFLWVGTVSGLYRFNTKTYNYDLFTEREGLPNNLIYCIEEDCNGNIWVGTNWGLAMLNTDTQNFSVYGVNDGLQSYEFNIGASHKSDDGELFFGGTSGFNCFYPDSIIVNKTIPKVAITHLEILGGEGTQSFPVQGVSEIVIEQDFSLLSIEFAALDFTRPEKNRYMYKVDGLDDGWIELGAKHSATFSNPGEGTYLFFVKGSNNDNVWSEQPETIRIVIRTRFWKSRVALAIYSLLVFSALFIFVRSRTINQRRTSRLLKEREQTMAKIERQKEELELKNKSITDSIHYAKRIQEALIPGENHFKEILPDSFILYLPKDIVSGDFYWINETQNKIFVAVIDCTGHGVPGAFMSIIGIELLRNITNIQGVNDAAEILNHLNKGVYDTFRVGVGQETNVKDGMDVSFCVLDKENNTLQFAGAFTNLYIVRDSKIIEIKGDRFSVGMEGETERPLFKSHIVPIEQSDMIYMFTDGYVDQFGGTEGKKFKFRRFRHLLLNIHKLTLEEQKKSLNESISEWRGAQEQVDDILIIGIKPDLSCFF